MSRTISAKCGFRDLKAVVSVNLRHDTAMIAKILIAWCLVAATVMFHAAALGIMLNPVLRLTGQVETRFLSVTWLVAQITWWLIVIHLLEIALWALFFWWQKCLPDVESSFYFSGVTYATIGYGDLVLPKEWRMFGPLEGLTGILLSGLSTAFLFATLSRIYADRPKTRRS
jgi:hypothetical protein